MSTYTVSATHKGPQWVLTFPSIDAVYYTPTFKSIPDVARRFLAFKLDVDPACIDIRIALAPVAGLDVSEALANIEAKGKEARRLQAEANAEAQELAHHLRTAGVDARDVESLQEGFRLRDSAALTIEGLASTVAARSTFHTQDEAKARLRARR